MAHKGKILIIRGGAIGDFILTLPVFAALRAQFPQARLEVLGYVRIAQIALAGGLVDGMRSIEARPLAGFFAQRGELDPDLARYFSEFDLIISFLYDPDQVFQANISRCSKAQFIVGTHRPSDDGPRHATECFLQALERLAIFEADPVPRLQLVKGGSTVDPILTTGSWLAVHPGSGSERKNWPDIKWSELLEKVIQSTALNIFLLGGEAEGSRLEVLAARLPASRWALWQNHPLPDVAGALQQCRAYIGHDSGLSHLAAALGLPGIVLWGPTSEHVWRPRSERMVLLRDPAGLAHVPVSRVFESLRALGLV